MVYWTDKYHNTPIPQHTNTTSNNKTQRKQTKTYPYNKRQNLTSSREKVTSKKPNLLNTYLQWIGKLGGGLLTYIKHSTTQSTQPIQSNKLSESTPTNTPVSNLYIPQWDTTSTQYATLNTDITNYIQHIINIQNSTCNVNPQKKHSVIQTMMITVEHWSPTSNCITLNTHLPTEVPKTSSPHITSVYSKPYNNKTRSITCQHSLH